MKTMRVLTKDQDDKIPTGMAALYMDGNGWVGTSNGYPHTGSPALFPIAQAEAIAYAWGFLMNRGVKVFDHKANDNKWKEYKGLALFDLFPVNEDTLSWMDGTRQTGPTASSEDFV